MIVFVALVKCLLEIGCLIKTAEVLTGRKGKSGNILQYCIIILMLAISVYVNFYDGSSLFQMVHYAGLFCILMIRYKMDAIDTVIYTMFCFLLVGALELLVYLPINLFCRFLGENRDCSVFVLLIILLLYHLAGKKKITIVNRRWIASYKENINIRFVIIIFVILLVFVVSLIRFDEGMPLEEGVYLLVALLIFLTLVYKLSAYQMEIDYHKKYADKYGEVVTELRDRQHKIMNQLDSVYALCRLYDNYDELVQHQTTELDNLRRYLMPGKILILERPLVVAHIYTKLCEAEEKQIDVHTDFSCSLEHINIPDIFLIEILGNLVDNAMDEVLARKKHEKIRVAITDDGNEVCISVGNEHEKIPYKEYSNFFKNGYSSKGNGRGVGLPYLKKIVDKFHGRIEIGNVIFNITNYFVISIYFKR